MTDSATDATIKLFAFGTGWGVPFATGAPFPLKLATWLRMAGLPFDFVVANDPSKGPTGKSPWIEYGSVRMGDSSLIIEYLEQRFGIDLDAHLDARQRALALSVQRMLEEHYHQCYEHQFFFGRGANERVHTLAASFPVPLRWLVPSVLRRAFSKQLYARGMGRHSEEAIIAQGKADLDALAELLGQQPYVLGDRPSAIDACAFGFLGVSLYVAGDNPLYRYGASLENLMRYCERMRASYFPETLSRLPPLFPTGLATGAEDSGPLVDTREQPDRAAVAAE
jgi:glutathione S-transferase